MESVSLLLIFSGIGEMTDGTWQTIGSGVADYLAALPLPLHHLLKYSSPEKRDETNIVTTATAPANVSLTQVRTLPSRLAHSKTLHLNPI